MKHEIPSQPAYRRVVADLRGCEGLYGALLKSVGATADSDLASAPAAIKSEVRQRRRLEAQMLGVGGHRRRYWETRRQ